MSFIKTDISGLLIFEPKVLKDDRGYFYEAYNEKRFSEAGVTLRFVQDNQSFSTKGVLRGLHLQKGEHAQAKLVRVTQGEVLDVAVDLRKGSATYGQYESVLLSAENNQQFFIDEKKEITLIMFFL